ncbi:MAG: BadF/BadG/BcrA/BcrD ATPase family protein [Rhizobiaceae bacterium]
MRFIIGIDGGGTSCRAALALASGEIVGRAKAGSANIHSNWAGASGNIVESARNAFLDAGEDPALISDTPAVLGLAGANVGTFRQQLEATLPFKKSVVETDAMIALEGAIGGGDGAIGILGTGTAYMARRDGIGHHFGGWGFLIGDQGSGARLGRDLLEETLLAFDGVRPASPLTGEVLSKHGNDPRGIVAFTLGAKPGDFASYAPMVFEHAQQGDVVAKAIVERATRAIEAALAALHLAPTSPLCLLGGLAPLYAPRLSDPYRTLLREPRQDALGGAVSMAVRLFGGTV